TNFYSEEKKTQLKGRRGEALNTAHRLHAVHVLFSSATWQRGWLPLYRESEGYCGQQVVERVVQTVWPGEEGELTKLLRLIGNWQCARFVDEVCQEWMGQAEERERAKGLLGNKQTGANAVSVCRSVGWFSVFRA